MGFNCCLFKSLYCGYTKWDENWGTVLTICSAMRQTQISTPYLTSIVHANKKWTDGEKQNEERGGKKIDDQNMQTDGTWEGNIPREILYMLLNEINEVVQT